MRLNSVKKLVVKYNGQIVGYLAELKNKRIAFQYDAEWVENGFAISPFSLPLSNEIYQDGKDVFNGLYGVFWDSLPDGWGELLIKRMLAQNGINYDKLTPLQKLSLVEKNGLGALEYEPCQASGVSNGNFDLDHLAEETRRILNDEMEDVDLDTIYRLGGSSGGARPKAHVKIAGEEWIIKFPCQIDPQNIGEQEYNMNLLASQCDIQVNEFDLFVSKRCSGYFGAKRFDRKGNRKVHTVSLAGLLETSHRIPNLDYGHLFHVIEKICVDKGDLYEAFRRMCFNVTYQNKDDHSKNFSFLYDEEVQGYRLSPAYDLTHVPNKYEHEMTINGQGNPTEDDMLELARDFKLSIQKCREIIKKTSNNRI